MAKIRYKGKGFSSVKSTNKERKHWADQLEPIRWSNTYEGKSMLVRIVSDLFPEGTHWVYTDLDDLGKNSFGSSLKGKRFMVVCPDWNPEEEKSSRTSCYICKHLSSADMLGGIRINWYVQAYVATKKKDGKIKWGDEPVVLVFPTTAINEIKNMMETVGNGVEPNDPKHGYSIWITYKNGGAGKASWSCQKGEEVSLKSLGMSKDDIIDFGEYFEATPSSDIDESMERIGYIDFIDNGGKKKKSKSIDDEDEDDDSDLLDEDDDDEDEDEKSSKKKKSKKDFDDEDEDVEDSDDSDEDDDEDEKPKKKKKGFDEDDDDDSDDEDSDDDDEDEKPSKKSKKKKDEDDDEDEDEEDSDSDDEDDEDEDEKPAKKSKKKGKFDDEDDDDEDSDSDDDEDEDDEPKKKKKKTKKFDDEDEDEDEKPKKKKKSKKFDDDDED